MSCTLTINGAEQDLAAQRISLDRLDVSWAAPRELRFV
jgi:hypothetical protein